MDAVDPRVDYLKIDKWMNSNKYDKVVDYCKKLDCFTFHVIQIWFEASGRLEY